MQLEIEWEDLRSVKHIFWLIVVPQLIIVEVKPFLAVGGIESSISFVFKILMFIDSDETWDWNAFFLETVLGHHV